MVKIYRSSASRRDLAGIVEFVARENPRAAAALLERIDRAVRAPAGNPQMGPVHRELRGTPRGVVVRPYIVLYHDDGESVRILFAGHDDGRPEASRRFDRRDLVRLGLGGTAPEALRRAGSRCDRRRAVDGNRMHCHRVLPEFYPWAGIVCTVTEFVTEFYPEFTERTLPIDATVALRCARLHVPDRRADRDALIAATAIVHGMAVVTRNIADFKATAAPVVNPWDDR